MVEFSNLHYVSILRTKFDSLEIDLRDTFGNTLPFNLEIECETLFQTRQAINQLKL